MFIIIAMVRVVPTLRYQGTVKSTYLPFSRGKLAGTSNSGILAFTIRIKRAVLMNWKKRILGTLLAFSSVLFL